MTSEAVRSSGGGGGSAGESRAGEERLCRERYNERQAHADEDKAGRASGRSRRGVAGLRERVVGRTTGGRRLCARL